MAAALALCATTMLATAISPRYPLLAYALPPLCLATGWTTGRVHEARLNAAGRGALRR